MRTIVDLATGSVTTDNDYQLPERPPATVHEVKAEANRRILAIMPEHVQRNTMARGFENVMTYGADVSQWPAEEQQAAAESLAAWAKIKTIRAKSNVIEAMPTLPTDLSDDTLWE